MKNTILEMLDIHKSFGNTKALSGISLSLEKGDILGLCGENGAGKSTLMKILSGVYPKSTYEGEILINNQKISFKNTVDAEKNGIAIIHQELNLVPNMTVMENIWLGRYLTKFGKLNKDKMNKETRMFCKGLAPHIDPTSKIKDLSTAERQIVEIIKAVSKDVKILIFDEPTSSLTEVETKKLIMLIKDLQALGVTSVYISHKLNEIFELTNKVAVIRDGKSVGYDSTENLTENKIISMMVGRDLDTLSMKQDYKPEKIVFEAKEYTAYSNQNPNIKTVDNASFCLYEGEILGFSGLIGAGRTELMTCIYGVYDGKYIGKSYLYDKLLNINSPQDAINNHIAYVPEERKLHGIIANQKISSNITLSILKDISKKGILDLDLEKKLAQEVVKDLKIKIPSLDSPISSLSGGNQQKCIIGKNLLIKPKILILDEPTRGVDVGAKFEIYKYINQIAKDGCSVIIVSSELPEIINMCNRVIVMSEGKIQGELVDEAITQESIMNLGIGS